MPVTAALVAVGVSSATSIYGAKKSADASKEAAATQAASGNQAIDLAREQFNAQQQRQQPYVQAGTDALRQLQMRQNAAPMQMPMFNSAQRGGGWTPQNYAQQQPMNRYAQMWNSAQGGQ